MTHCFRLICLTTVVSLAAALPASAASPVPVVFGSTWDSPANSLQNILDAQYGAGQIDVANDFIGKNVGDPDPFYWTGSRFSSLLIREVAGYSDVNVLGWYLETGGQPVIDSIDDGIVFPGPMSAGATALINLSSSNIPFGFYLNPNGNGGATNAPEPEKFFTNRLWNDIGPNGASQHAPTDGDVQALVFDLAGLGRPNTWVVCFEDLDSGAIPGPCCSTTDNDFNDMVFEVTVMGPVPVKPMTFSQIKALYK